MFPSGEWTAFWSHDSAGIDLPFWIHHLALTFDAETLIGGGTDLLGRFRVKGRVNGDRLEVAKRYVGRHEVQYSGRLGFRGCVVGWWRIGGTVGGRFIWVPPGGAALELAEAYARTLG